MACFMIMFWLLMTVRLFMQAGVIQKIAVRAWDYLQK